MRKTPQERTLAAECRAVEATRFWPRVDTNGPRPEYRPSLGPCWLWKRGRSQGGYGVLTLGRGAKARRQIRAHTFAYVLLVGEPPVGLQPDHLCRVRHCVNPSHIEWVTGRENSLRSLSPAAFNARKDRCIRGHPFDESNTYWYQRGGWAVRGCRTCRSMKDRIRKIEKMQERHQRQTCQLGHDWSVNERINREGRHYCHACRVEFGQRGRRRA